ncbi:MAG: ABC transporter permease [Deltaproteobacteria bacterium]|nr:ABC transporter permease [Deltaproteobacteria bacterium]MBW1962786.1 ABC transporter permease [Deltaproteobacteria bacterium]MBW1993813.1 ABC transporter permease [Deltaproteobacteria bacterium]MBW2150472.1 ABC transporter permease [Deltaproteobacteria bacterium]
MERRRTAFSVFKESKVAIAGSILIIAVSLVAVFAPWLSPYDPREQSILNRFASPQMPHLFGTDEFGRDILSRVIWGSRTSLTVGILSVVFSGILGTCLGIIAGYNGGFMENMIMRMTDAFLSLPSLLMGLIVIVALGSGTSKVIIAISVALTPRFIRLAHGPTLSLREIGYVEAARASGSGGFRIMLQHILPNIIGPIAVMATLWVATAIRIEASLSFLGLGTQPPNSSWGLMLKSGVNNIIISPWLAVFPGIAIMLAVMSFNMVGDGLRDALDPRLQG